MNKKELIFNTDKIINKYYNSINFKEEWIKKYLIQINKLHKKEISNILNIDKNSILFQSLYTYFCKKEKIRVYEGYLSFLQALWDNIYYISDLDYLCNCYEIAKKRKFKNKNFYFIGAKLICKKYLKILQIEIIYERYLLIKLRKSLKKYRNNILNIIFNDKKNKNIIKKILNKNNITNIITWKKITENQWFKYDQKQKQLISNLLPDEAAIIKGKILEYFHKYHLELLNNKLKNKEKKNLIKIKKLNKKNITIYNQIFGEIEKIINNLNIKINLFKFNIKNLNKLDYIKIKLINSVLCKKELIILNNIFNKLTNNEIDELNKILLNIKKYNPKLIFLIITKNIENIKNNITQILFFDEKNNYKIMSKKNAEYLPHTINLYKMMHNDSKNIFIVKFFSIENILKNEKIKIKLSKKNNLIDKKEYYLAINPNLISFKKTKEFNKDLHLIYKGYIKTIKKNIKYNICFFEISNNLIFKILINKKELNLKKITKIYFEKKSLLIYDIKNGFLIFNI